MFIPLSASDIYHRIAQAINGFGRLLQLMDLELMQLMDLELMDLAINWN